MSKTVTKPRITIVHANMHSTVTCSCGWFGYYRSFFNGMHASYANSKADTQARQHNKREHAGKYRIKEKKAERRTDAR